VVASLAPAQIGRALVARLAALTADETSSLALLSAVVVLGPEADLASCAQLAGIELPRAMALVDCLVDDGILRAGIPLRFEHPVVKAAASHEAGSGVHARLHLAAARLLDRRETAVETVAEHLLTAENCGEQWVARRLEEAGRRALARGDRVAARGFLEKALTDYPRTAGAALHVDLARAMAPGELDRAVYHLGRAVALEADMNEVAEVALALADSMPEGDLPSRLVTTLRTTAARLPTSHRDLRVRLEVAAAAEQGRSAEAHDALQDAGSSCAASKDITRWQELSMPGAGA
jgi:hypothetical protein